MAQMSYERALNKAMEICSKAEKCISDIEKKLSVWEVEPESAQKIIRVLQEEKFIDEKRYTSFFVNDKFKFNKWGRIKIGFILKGKGIPQTIIQDALEQIEENDYLATLKQLFQQKTKSTKANSNWELKAKLVRFAQGRGFEYDIISKALSEILMLD